MLDEETLKVIAKTSKNIDEMWDRIIYEKQKECLNCMFRIRCEAGGNYLCLKHMLDEEI